MVTESRVGSRTSRRRPGGDYGRRRSRDSIYFAAGVLAASNFSAKLFCCFSSFVAKANDAYVISCAVGSSGAAKAGIATGGLTGVKRAANAVRSEERRVGKECRGRGAQVQGQKKRR